jgi:hypothetical protein
MKKILTCFLLIVSALGHGQDINTTNFIEQIKDYDISSLLILDKFEIENDTVSMKRQEPLGYIGANYPRLHVHFISAIQNPNNKLQYFIYGKTKVKKNICEFQGTITINESRTYDEGDIPTLKQGYVKGQYEFFENPNQKHTGKLKGNFQSNFYIDEKGALKYDALMFVSDGFKNNQFEGIWTNYKSGVSKKCNWGDYRIPDSRGFDIGTGEFNVDKEYVEFGWESYGLAWGHYPLNSENTEAELIENEKWWIDN